jgi:hypothetical protein
VVTTSGTCTISLSVVGEIKSQSIWLYWGRQTNGRHYFDGGATITWSYSLAGFNEIGPPISKRGLYVV